MLLEGKSLFSKPFPPEGRKKFHQTVIDEILEERVVSSRGKNNLRALKRQYMGYPKKPPNAKTKKRDDLITILVK